jgi:hypothetical protein
MEDVYCCLVGLPYGRLPSAVYRGSNGVRSAGRALPGVSHPPYLHQQAHPSLRQTDGKIRREKSIGIIGRHLG